MHLVGRRYDTGVPVRVEIARGKVASVAPCTAGPAESLPWIAPGLIDIQVNGYGGQEFSSAELTPEKVAQIARAMDPFGVTRFCPTLTTASFEVLCGALRAIAQACDTSAQLARRIAGIHLEGPYISTEDGPRGAHPRHYCHPPNWDEFQRLQEAAAGRIAILTMAVEFPETAAFIRRAAKAGVVVAIGHTAADPDQIRAAVDAGARISTHLGNGCHAMLPRHRNCIWPQLAEDRLAAGLIVDGHHLPAECVKTFVRAKTPGRCILTSDLSGMAGLKAGRYQTNLCQLDILADGRLVIAGQSELLAGASAPIGTGIANVMRFAGVRLPEAVAMAVHNPAKLLGIEPGGLEPGQPAELILFDLEERFELCSMHLP